MSLQMSKIRYPILVINLLLTVLTTHSCNSVHFWTCLRIRIDVVKQDSRQYDTHAIQLSISEMPNVVFGYQADIIEIELQEL